MAGALAAGPMAGALSGRLGETGARAPRRGFSLTPLADIMFQLLIFFMLSSSLAPYALLPLTPPAASTEATPDAPPRPASEARAATLSQVVWHLEREAVRAGDIRIALSALPEALATLREDGIADIVVFVTRAARAQDLASLLEPVARAGFARLQLIGR